MRPHWLVPMNKAALSDLSHHLVLRRCLTKISALDLFSISRTTKPTFSKYRAMRWLMMCTGSTMSLWDGALMRVKVVPPHVFSLIAPSKKSMYTEAKTFANFMTNLMQGNGLSEQSYINMLEPQVEIPTDPEEGDSPWPQRYSLGFRLTNTPYGLAYGHDGSNGDFTCRFEIYKERDMGFIIFTNNDTGTAFYKKCRNTLLREKSIKCT